MTNKITMFYGTECPHCHRMMPAVDRLQKEEGIEVEKVEVWHNPDNAKRMEKFRKIIEEACGGGYGVPAFVDEKNNRAFCGEAGYEDFKYWAKEK